MEGAAVDDPGLFGGRAIRVWRRRRLGRRARRATIWFTLPGFGSSTTVQSGAQVVAHEVGQVIGDDVDRVALRGVWLDVGGGVAEVFVFVAADPVAVGEGDGWK